MLEWNNPGKLALSRVILKCKLYFKYELIWITWFFGMSIHQAVNQDPLYLLSFLFLGFFIYLYNVKINFKVVFIKVKADIISIDFKDYVVLIEQDNNEIPYKITDPICTRQIKSAKLSFTGGSYIKGTAYCLVDPNSSFGNPNLYRVISPLKIFHVETIGCSNQKNTKPFNYK